MRFREDLLITKLFAHEVDNSAEHGDSSAARYFADGYNRDIFSLHYRTVAIVTTHSLLSLILEAGI